MAGRVFNGQEWSDVKPERLSGKQRPLPPILNGDGKIFVSIPSFRDGARCGKTIVDLFAKAKDPDQIVVGIIDQSYEEDAYCLEAYCKEMGSTIYDKKSIREDTIKVISKPEKKECPRIDQIRKLALQNVAAKGPGWARSMTRKLLGNEEFCLQIDAHSQFSQDWDDKAKHEWAATGNEFGIISTVPASLSEMEAGSETTVPRQCMVQFLEIGVPHYTSRGDGKVENLKKPLLSHAWSAGLSFSKCHLEESAPYDPFTPYVMGVEQFSRFARFWTRGYDVYTPTQNIVYHNYQANPDGHGPMEWLKPRFERFRQAALRRVRSYLELPDSEEGLNLSNLGMYGLGKRRTLEQMASFIHIDMDSQSSRVESMACGDDEWVPFDANISPVANLHDKPDNLDPQPEFPLRTELIFYKESDWEPSKLEILEGDLLVEGGDGEVLEYDSQKVALTATAVVDESPFPSAVLMMFLWMIGLCLWCAVFVGPFSGGPGRQKAQGSRKARSGKKNVKDV